MGLATSSLGLACPREDLSTASSSFWVSGQGRANSNPGLAAVHADTGVSFKYPSGFRGHDVAADPGRPGRVILFGRRPGRECIVVDLSDGQVQARIPALAGHAFQGHGFFSPDGQWLVTVEADLSSEEGKLSIRDAARLSVVEVHDTFGIGPHEAALLPDASTVVVANGGLLTREETGREVLNLSSMDSSLVYLDLDSGRLLEQHRVEERLASIRHLDVMNDATVAVGLQIQRAGLTHNTPLPLCGRHRRGEQIQLFDSEMAVFAAMNDYVGSVAVSSVAGIAAFSSPHGNLCVAWRVDDGQLAGIHQLYDGCGLATSLDEEQFILSSSTGEVRTLHATNLAEVRAARRKIPGIQWDNHLLIIDAKGWSS